MSIVYFVCLIFAILFFYPVLNSAPRCTIIILQIRQFEHFYNLQYPDCNNRKIPKFMQEFSVKTSKTPTLKKKNSITGGWLAVLTVLNMRNSNSSVVGRQRLLKSIILKTLFVLLSRSFYHKLFYIFDLPCI